jgi:transcriptional regulator with XRE-family HTH domain
MDKKLNVDLIESCLQEQGQNQAGLAKSLGVSREIVSQWLKNKKTPTPKNVLQLSRLLNLHYKQIFLSAPNSEPRVAFRKKGNAKTTEKHIDRAMAMGNLLKQLVPFLPFDNLSSPPILKNPSLDYSYIQRVVSEVRSNLNLKEDHVNIEDLIDCFNSLHAVIIPVLWGAKKNHENALHIYLPDSMTTWVYLNLDTKIHDFKFWMLHELGHTKSPSLTGDEGENFSDRFAGAFLFPDYLAKREYEHLRRIPTPGSKVNRIIETADSLTISPFTVLGETNEYAKSENLPQINLKIGGAATNLTKKFKLVSEAILGANLKIILIFPKRFLTPRFLIA